MNIAIIRGILVGIILITLGISIFEHPYKSIVLTLCLNALPLTWK